GDVLTHALRPNHDKLRRVLCREMGLREPDIDIDRLAFAIIGLASIYFHGRRMVEEISPELMHGAHIKSATVDRLTMYAIALIECERKRRLSARRE
ncbi:MAG: CerR family C-terminal domain-containing protein, partial [Gallionella sp.]|nr:CerR family C-terminal domain-containing protein [Gallionella sp.]